MTEKQEEKVKSFFIAYTPKGAATYSRTVGETMNLIDEMLAEQKRLILEEGEKLYNAYSTSKETLSYLQALTDYQDRIKKICK